MIRLDKVTKQYADQMILGECSWAIKPNRIIGVVGPNGAGKTTLLRLITGEEAVDGGSVERAGGVNIGYLPQDIIDVRGDQPVLEFILSGQSRLLELEARLEDVESKLQSDDDPSLVQQQATLRDQYEIEGGYRFRVHAREIASGMGFAEADFDRPLSTFSGGWRMRALLAQLLLKSPDYLLLDEPTNHLDSESLQWLERFLTGFVGTTLLVSHDRYFLNAVVDEIAELQFGGIRSYASNYDGYREQKLADREQLLAAKANQEREIAHIQRFIERFRYKNTKAKSVQGRIKKLERIERIDVGPDEEASIRFRFPQPSRTPKVLAKLQNVQKRYGDVDVYSDLNFALYRGEKVALVGPNGGGKTTLLKMLNRAIEHDAGVVEIADVKVAYFAQHAADGLDASRTVEQSVLDVAEATDSGMVRNVLGAFGFSGDDVSKRVGVLSGGEKNRVALARLMFEKASVLLLDEPTNHLDIASRQVLEFAINDFDGAVVVVSHDRYFVNEVAQRVVHIEHGKADEFVGDYDEYLASISDSNSAPVSAESNPASKKEKRRAAAVLRKKVAEATDSLKKEKNRIESTIAELERSISEDEAAMTQPEIFGDSERLAEVSKRYREQKATHEQLLERWMEIEIEIESIESELEVE